MTHLALFIQDVYPQQAYYSISSRVEPLPGSAPRTRRWHFISSPHTRNSDVSFASSKSRVTRTGLPPPRHRRKPADEARPACPAGEHAWKTCMRMHYRGASPVASRRGLVSGSEHVFFCRYNLRHSTDRWGFSDAERVVAAPLGLVRKFCHRGASEAGGYRGEAVQVCRGLGCPRRRIADANMSSASLPAGAAYAQRWVLCTKSCSRAWCASFYTFPVLRSQTHQCPHAVIHRVRGVHFIAPLAPHEVVRSEEMSNARSSLGYSAIDVKRFCAVVAIANAES